MRGFTIWLAGEVAGLRAELAARLTDMGFRSEPLTLADLSAIAGDPGKAEELAEFIARRLTAHRVVVLAESAVPAARPWPELRVSTGPPWPEADLLVHPSQCGLPAAAGQIMHELMERELTGDGDDKNAVLARLKSIGYLG